MRLSSSACALSLATAASAGRAVADFDWTTLEPSTSLNYTKCYDGEFKCAKLAVPLDWLDPERSKDGVVLAVMARPASVPEDDPSFGGTILTNPGGPSGSGVDFLLRAAEGLQRDTDSEKKFEMLSWDPRGVGLTTPSSDCYNNEFARSSAKIEVHGLGRPGSSESVSKIRFARSKAFGAFCERNADGDDIRDYMSTSSVARDMIAIVDAVDDLRKSESEGNDNAASGEDRLELRTEPKDDTPRLQYWGFSYGSVLGNYAASMFPERVGRVLLEAVVDINDYYQGKWEKNLFDIDDTYWQLFENCFDAKSDCALYKESDEGPKDIHKRVEDFLDSLEASPEPYVTNVDAISITKEDVIALIFHAAYAPLRAYPPLAEQLAAGMDGNFTAIYDAMSTPKAKESCDLPTPMDYTWNNDAMMAIACGDAVLQTDMTFDEYMAYIDTLTAQSEHFGPAWSDIRLACTGWNYRPKYNFSGPWTTPEHDASLVKGKPAAPLLFVTSRYDPVTPLINAKTMSKSHTGSRVVIQENSGHGAAHSPGKCRENIVQKYFATGELPEEDVVCETECKPFKDCPRATEVKAFDIARHLF